LPGLWGKPPFVNDGIPGSSNAQTITKTALLRLNDVSPNNQPIQQLQILDQKVRDFAGPLRIKKARKL
jgi:hypothetical protein